MTSRNQLEAQVHVQPNLAIIRLCGEIDAAAEGALTRAYDQATANNPPAVLLSFQDVGYMNSSGIALIVGLLIQAQRSGRGLAACGLTDHFAEIFRITRLSDYIDVYPDEECAKHAKPPREALEMAHTGSAETKLG